MQTYMYGVQKTTRFYGVDGGDIVYKHRVMQQNKQRLGYGLLTIPLSNGITITLEVITQDSISRTQLYKCDYNTNIDVVNTHKYTPTLKTLSRIINQVYALTDTSNITPYAYQHQHIVCAECYNSKADRCYCSDCFVCCKFVYYSDIEDINTAYKHIDIHNNQYMHLYCSYCGDCIECCIGYCYE